MPLISVVLTHNNDNDEDDDDDDDDIFLASKKGPKQIGPLRIGASL